MNEVGDTNTFDSRSSKKKNKKQSEDSDKDMLSEDENQNDNLTKLTSPNKSLKDKTAGTTSP